MALTGHDRQAGREAMGCPTMFTLSPRRWYAWQALPLQDERWPCTPVWIAGAKPLKTGGGLLQIDAILALDWPGARRVSARLKVIRRAADHLLAEWRDEAGRERTVALQEVSFDWMYRHCDELFLRIPPNSWSSWSEMTVERYLDLLFGDEAEDILRGAGPKSHGIGRTATPRRRAKLTLDLTYHGLDAYLLRRGFIPDQMEDKWFCYVENERLLMLRSWTGHLIYELPLIAEPDGSIRIVEALANRNPKQYLSSDDAHDVGAIAYLIDIIVLRKDPPPPEANDPTNAADPGEAALKLWDLAGRAAIRGAG